ncbi:MAG: ArsR/SmtB family transcription factor [Spirochaetaceae bacterium]
MSLRIEIIPAFELIGAALNYSFRNEDSENRIFTSRSIIRWRKKVEAEISPFLSSDIEGLFKFHLPVSFLQGVALRFDLNTPENLLEWLASQHVLSAKQLILELSDLQGFDPASIDEKAVREKLENIESLFHSSIDEEAAVVMYALEYTEAFLRRLYTALSDFYDFFVREELPQALSLLEEKQKEHQSVLNERADTFLNRITLDNYGSLYSPEEEIRIVISYFANRFLTLHTSFYKLIVYGIDMDQRLSGLDTPGEVDNFLKALADPKRTAIMRLLKRRQWYGKELADHFSLTTATMSYHLEKLLSSRLIQFETAEKNRILYSINRKGMEEMLQLMREDFL